MRKLFAILLLLLLPLQASWAAVAGYCQHEQGTATRHLGHHEHQHQQHPQTQKTASHEAAAAINAAADLDCSLCHAGCLLAMLTEPGLSAAALPVAGLAASIDPPPSSAPLDLPERPNWS